ncbi:MAG: hypothetical protein KJ950_10690 [Proteobacteria bacterium]|nr:hypothetical protein [Pseudomonadota bacterium]MBU1687469.1 hypothetical protein [Pseudomonadota bacterium]
MRVTMRSSYQSIITNLNSLNSDLFSINNRISSGKEMSKLSDDPVSLALALGLRTTVVEIKQYQENLGFGDDVIAASEEALQQIKELTIRAKTLALQAINASQTPDTRASIASEAVNLFEQSVVLGNTQVNGKYIFGGYRSTGYTTEEPEPFIVDKRDGYLVSGGTPTIMNSTLTATVTNNAIAAGALAVNGNVVGVINTAAAVNGLNMTKAANAVTALSAADPAISATVTTLTSSGAVTDDPVNGVSSQFFFYLNGQPVTVVVPDGTSSVTAAVAAINGASDLTGVQAVAGDTTNGGANNTIVFQNLQPGDDSAIIVTDFQVLSAGGAALGFGNFNQVADATHNNGQISIGSSQSFTLTSPLVADDSILAELGLGGGGVGFNDDPGDGILGYGYSLAAGDLLVNGYATSAAVDDGISEVYGDSSAAAKAAVINAQSKDTGVSATVTPAVLGAFDKVEAGTGPGFLTGTVSNGAIAAGDLEINTFPLSAIAPGAVTNGLNTGKAYNVREVVNQFAAATGVTGRLTTLSAGGVAAGGTLTTVSFDLNGVPISFSTSTDPALDALSAIQTASNLTGVTAVLGNGNNGGAIGSVVLQNAVTGDESDIVITGFNSGVGSASTGLGNINQVVDATHNTGEISLSSATTIDLTSPNNLTNDFILDELGLGGGEAGTMIVGDMPNDGKLSFGSTPVLLNRGDLVINGVDIFDAATMIRGLDPDNQVINAINDKTALTGVTATRTGTGALMLSAIDGRNLHVQTSAMGESVTHLNGGSPPLPQDRVYSGYIQLFSDRRFTLEAPPTAGGYESGLASFGLAGGATNAGEPTDVAGDGRIDVVTIGRLDDYVRYAGDRLGDFEIKVGSRSTLAVGKNGYDAISQTGVFVTLKGFEKALLGQDFKQVTSVNTASAPSQNFAGGSSGLAGLGELVDGNFRITVTDYNFYNPRVLSTTIPVSAEYDSLDSVATKINGIPGIHSYVDDHGALRVEVDDPDRYSMNLQDESGNFLNVMGITPDQLQIQALEQCIADLDNQQIALTRQVSDFGARANRISIQTSIFNSIELGTVESLSEVQDTDIVRAVMDLRAKQTAYEAALSTAAQVMQLSLVDFL